MKTKISVFITAIALLLDVTATLAQGTQAYFKKDGVTVFQSPISEIDSIVFKQATNDDNCSVYDDPQGVVINGVRWATRNVGAPGAFASSPCDDGGYYQFNKGTTDFLSDYYMSDYFNSDTWLPANDPSPAGWRVPTFDEIQKLLDTDNVTYEWIDNNGFTGGKYTDKSTGNSLFLPAAGYRDDLYGILNNAGINGFYWSSTVAGFGAASGLAFDKDYNDQWGDWNTIVNYRGNGVSVRPVAK